MQVTYRAQTAMKTRKAMAVHVKFDCCRHASIRTLKKRFVSLGACWAFSVQPALPSVWRPVILLLESRTWARRLTQSPELGFGLLSFLFLERFCFYAAAATVVKLLLCNGSYTSPLTHR
jgi:hypothetical protein